MQEKNSLLLFTIHVHFLSLIPLSYQQTRQLTRFIIDAANRINFVFMLSR